MTREEESCSIDSRIYSEWILSNRLGGYAFGTGDLINTRKYHGLLVASNPDLRRLHLVSSVEEKIGVNGESMYIDSCSYPNTIYPNGYTHLVRSWLRPYPAFLFSSSPFSDHILILKEVMMDEERNVALLRYTNLGTVQVQYFLRYKFTLRDHHFVNPPGTFDRVSLDCEVFGDGPGGAGWVVRRDNGVKAYVYATEGSMRKDLLNYRGVFFAQEANRGYDAVEDLVSPFLHEGRLESNGYVETLFSDRNLADHKSAAGGPSSGGKPPAAGGSLAVREVARQAAQRIRERYADLPLPQGHPLDTGGSLGTPSGNRPDIGTGYRGIVDKGSGSELMPMEVYLRTLEGMLDDFRLTSDLVAGFPWFSARGRDTMISLQAFIVRAGGAPDVPPGAVSHPADLPLKRGPGQGARDGDVTGFVSRTLENYGRRMRRGIIPNYIEESGEGTNYDTVDVSLWYVLRAFEIFDFLPPENRSRLFAFCEAIVLRYRYGRELPFFCDEDDALIEIRSGSNLALTWMDARVYGVPVTPRPGKTVEVNGLWHCALRACGAMARRLGREKLESGSFSLSLEELDRLAAEVGKSMGKFFRDGVWCDRIEGGAPVDEIRPNFVVALSLPFDFTGGEGLKRGAALAREHLLTPFGLRSLAMSSPMFRGRYVGNQKMRDLAYHQGTVWPWLLLPYAQLLEKTTSDRGALKIELSEIVSSLRCGVRKGVFASIAEVWDGEGPALPKGALAQAWSVAALYCIERMIDSG